MQSSLMWVDPWLIRLSKQQASGTVKPGQANALCKRVYLVASEVQSLRDLNEFLVVLCPLQAHNTPLQHCFPLNWQDDEEEEGVCSSAVYSAVCGAEPISESDDAGITFPGCWLDSVKSSSL